MINDVRLRSRARTPQQLASSTITMTSRGFRLPSTQGRSAAEDVLRFDHGVAPSTELPRKVEPKKKEVVIEEDDDSSDPYGLGSGGGYDIFGNKIDDDDEVVVSSNEPQVPTPEVEVPKPKAEAPKKKVPTKKVPMMAWHRTAMDEVVVLPVEATVVDEHETGKWNGRLKVPAGIVISKGSKPSAATEEMVEISADCFEVEPVDAMRKAIEKWRQSQISSNPIARYPPGRPPGSSSTGDTIVSACSAQRQT